MAYKGFVGSGTVGHFATTTALQNQYPADTYAGRMATVEGPGATAIHYFSNGTSWLPNAQLVTDSSGNTVGIADPVTGKEIYVGVGVLATSAVAIPHTGTTSATVLATVPVPANAMGPNGIVRITAYWSMTNNANNKNLIIRFGGAATQFWSAGLSSVAASGCQIQIQNRGATGSQIGNGGGTGVSFGTLPVMVTSSEDTTQVQNIQFVGNLTNAGDTLTLERYLVEIIK